MVYSFRNCVMALSNITFETSKIFIAVAGLSTVRRRPVIVSARDARSGISTLPPTPRSLWPDPGETVYASLQEIFPQ